MLWLSLVFPGLPIECLPGLEDSPQAWVLTDQGRVAACNPRAAAQGIRPGQRLGGAFALDPGLLHRAREPRAERECLQTLAEWALGFSSEVSLERDQALLLEVGSTERHFGGLASLLQRLCSDLEQRGHRVLHAVAPTPLAALWLACGDPGQVVRDLAGVPAALAALPLSCSSLDPGSQEALQGAGIASLGQLLALPASALARRCGPEVPMLLRRALGHHPDPRHCILPARRFQRSIELAYPLYEVPRLMAVLERMVPDLADWAWRQARLLTRIVLILAHERQASSRLEIGFAGTRSASHLQLVIAESLQRHTLQAPVAAVALQVLESLEAPPGSGHLLPAAPSRLREGQELLERLRARLGVTAVHGLATRADHRPELAWAYAEPGGASQGPPPAPAGPRPLWLLEQPRDLGSGSVPALGGPLTLLAGPERIESGWWDGGDIARDYFVAGGPDGPQYWVYRERRGEGRWFLQGVFA